MRSAVFEIGSGLREARERRGLSLAAIERDTRIRQRWLRALEEERFDLLPERVYALGFLRTYADYLSLDGQRFVDEFASRLPEDERYEVRLATQPAGRRRVRATTVLIALLLIALLGLVIGLIGLRGSRPNARSLPPRPATRSASPVVQPGTATRPVIHTPKPEVAKLVLEAAYGRCWLDARLGSQNGKELHMGTLELGQSLRLRGGRIWIRLGAPTALRATLNGKVVRLPSTTPVNVVVTVAGLREARG